ncbi:hypothetical protein RCH12_003252, partial [Cryobacterium sp. MP_3.1]|nr:hypothetical protein [Cryobacterium sp. MP_3.1]
MTRASWTLFLIILLGRCRGGVGCFCRAGER